MWGLPFIFTASAGFGFVLVLAGGLWIAAPGDNAAFTSGKKPNLIDRTIVASIKPSKLRGAGHVFDDGKRINAERRLSMFDTDPALQEAARIAKRTRGKFDEAFVRREGQNFSVKGIFSDNGQREAIWVRVTKLTDDGYLGELADRPKYLKGVEKGQITHILRDEIVDWMVQAQEGIYGAFTTRVLLSRQDVKAVQPIFNLIRDL